MVIIRYSSFPLRPHNLVLNGEMRHAKAATQFAALCALALALVSLRGAEAVCTGCPVDQYCSFTDVAACLASDGSAGVGARCGGLTGTTDCRSCPPGTTSPVNSLNSGMPHAAFPKPDGPCASCGALPKN